MKYQQYIRDWEEMAELDARWAILSDQKKIGGKWRDDEFFETGKKEIDQCIFRLNSLGIPIRYSSALDFGCGIGRLTKGLAAYFDTVTGIDLSKEMIKEAKNIHAENSRLHFVQKNSPPLDIFADNSFDFVHTNITLQHIPDHALIKAYLQEFMRILKPNGILYFQLPSTPNYSPMKERILRLRGHMFFALKKMGLPRDFLFKTARIKPYMHMSHLPSTEVRSLFSSSGIVREVFDDNSLTTTYVVQKTS